MINVPFFLFSSFVILFRFYFFIMTFVFIIFEFDFIQWTIHYQFEVLIKFILNRGGPDTQSLLWIYGGKQLCCWGIEVINVTFKVFIFQHGPMLIISDICFSTCIFLFSSLVSEKNEGWMSSKNFWKEMFSLSSRVNGRFISNVSRFLHFLPFRRWKMLSFLLFLIHCLLKIHQEQNLWNTVDLTTWFSSTILLVFWWNTSIHRSLLFDSRTKRERCIYSFCFLSW